MPGSSSDSASSEAEQFRIEKDSMGEVNVPEWAQYGAQTQRAVENFKISSLTMPAQFIRALAMIKLAAAQANSELELLDDVRAEAIQKAAQSIVEGLPLQQFPVDIFQTGSGTSTNMNMNEVIACRAQVLCPDRIHPNDHVNMGQSSNDVIPTAIHVSAAMALDQELIPAIDELIDTIEEKAKNYTEVVKTGRTHLMDAMPLTFSQEMGAWAQQLRNAKEGIHHAQRQVEALAQGGTAIGTGINAHPDFAEIFARYLSEQAQITFRPSDDFFASIAGQEAAVSLSGQLKTLACAMMKISNDLRWMNSGPLAGLGEIELRALQPGSSIMPGKVNPVIPEAVAMACAQVIGNDATVTLAGQSGNFQLNVMLPVIAYNLLQSIELLANSAKSLAHKAIASFSVKPEVLERALAMNPILVTALNSVVGYAKAAEIAKQAYQQQRPILEVAEEETDISRERLQELLDPRALTKGGIPG
ncbi:aspartate ammonia-lyase [Hahella sp. CCB-MM4]|uniref:class II fumarate hydratase n=1 Tax=Hahella sp. (strain CCB-MM4) TaxID=1926491 RepID=UPI000B9A1EB6|nr:class II fumarate hydratase [Hahella sp. CCB-MM4]OZG73295.1 aspartate ammonia-lyase [Hahella sp. CCB-MM4]